MDANRLTELVDTHAAALELFAGRWTSWPEDCVQEAFVELAKEPTEPRSVAAWLFRVVRNRAMNAARTERRLREREQAAARLRPTALSISFADALDAETATEALSQLNSDSYEVITLRIWAELSFPQIAETLGCSVSSAHRRYRRALQQLRDILEPTPCPTKTNCPKN